VNRAEFEQKLLEDEKLRAIVAGLRDVAAELEKLESDLAEMRAELHRKIRDLAVKHAVPKAFLARQAGLSPQRINSILHEQEEQHARRKRR
jgi:hypothetical protein